jgi:hypothetical protein
MAKDQLRALGGFALLVLAFVLMLALLVFAGVAAFWIVSQGLDLLARILGGDGRG